ncbi:MAG TPA: nucleoside triphosphate pyrophosphohydrolase [Syntrophobacteria bacterium]|nr:nucleoside triphosphate pyrophosphohydrolase [Syntrophobacteria bacterium]
MGETATQLERLLELVARLRAPDGCPWDREQSPATVKRYVLEEAYEVVDAVDLDSPAHVAEELGDLLFMLIFLAHLYGEQGAFRLDEVLQGVAEKMIRRHPHVFANRRVDSSTQVKENWEEIKRQEQSNASLGAALNGLPRSLPALMRAHRFISRLVRTLHRPLSKEILLGEFDRIVVTLARDASVLSQSSASALLGKVLFLLVALGFHADIRTEEALGETLERFRRWIEITETRLTQEGRSWRELSEAEERSLWQEL